MFEKVRNYVSGRVHSFILGRDHILAYVCSIVFIVFLIMVTMNITFGTSDISAILVLLTFVAEVCVLILVTVCMVCCVAKKIIAKRNYNKIQNVLFAVKHSNDEYTGKYLCSDVIDIPYKGIRKDNTVYFTANSDVLIVSKGEDTSAIEYDVCKVNHYLMQKNGYI